MSDTPKTIFLKDYKPPAFLVPQIDLHFDLFEDESFVDAKLILKRNQKSEHVDELFLDGEKLNLTSIQINGAKLNTSDYSVNDKGLTLKKLTDDMVLETRVRLEPQTNKAFSGLYKTKTVFCTQMEAQGFRRTTFFFDRPDVLSVYKTSITADKKKYPVLLSNGNFTEQSDTSDGRHKAVWSDPFPKPCYLFALVAGDLDSVEDKYITTSKRRVDLKIYVDKGKGDRAHFAMNSLKESMKWDEDTYGLEYDLDIYNIVAVDDFNMGAMENKGLNIFNSKFVLADTQSATDDEFQAIQRVIGHEYFHNWSGNRVTCRDWFQLSLKEGLTVFRDQEFSSDLNSRPVKRIEDVATLRARQFPEDAGPMAHPVRPSSYIAIDNFYTVTIYEKGAEVIRMLHTLLGAKLFQKGAAKYFELYDGQAVTTDDWIHAMELVSGRDLKQFKRWYDQTGTPTVSVNMEYNDQSQVLKLNLEQKTLDPITKKANQAYQIPIKMGLLSKSGDPLEFNENNQNKRTTVLELTENQQTFEFSNVKNQPVISLLQGFSAPIHLNFEQKPEDRYMLMANDSDSFNRWESAQKVYLQTLLQTYDNLAQGKPTSVSPTLIESLKKIIENSDKDPALAACLLKLPSAHYFSQFLDQIEPQQVMQAYRSLSFQISEELHDTLLKKYESLQSKNLENSPEDIAQRSLKNALINHLYRNDNIMGAPLFYQQFKDAKNMTDSISSLMRLSFENTKEFLKATEEFYNKWKSDSLVINKWLTVQALSKQDSAFENIKHVCKSSVYDQTNPNKVFALLYHFAQYNWSQFHKKDGSTYAWFADQIIDIDGRNPQIASRLGSCFNNWKQLSPEYANAMKSQLQRIHDSTPSKNLFEIVDRALKQ